MESDDWEDAMLAWVQDHQAWPAAAGEATYLPLRAKRLKTRGLHHGCAPRHGCLQLRSLPFLVFSLRRLAHLPPPLLIGRAAEYILGEARLLEDGVT